MCCMANKQRAVVHERLESPDPVWAVDENSLINLAMAHVSLRCCRASVNLAQIHEPRTLCHRRDPVFLAVRRKEVHEVNGRTQLAGERGSGTWLK